MHMDLITPVTDEKLRFIVKMATLAAANTFREEGIQGQAMSFYREERNESGWSIRIDWDERFVEDLKE